MPELPTGTVTFLFTDIEGSTKLLQGLGSDSYAEELAEHRRVLRTAFEHHGGAEVDTQGDGFFVAFPTAPGALDAAREAQAAVALPVRMGLHTGTPLLTDEGYVGNDVHQAARIAAAGNGGQVLVSASTAALLDASNSPLLDLGKHRLKDFAEPVSLFQLGADRFPPLRTISNTNLPVPLSSFVGREREMARVLSLIREGVRLLTLAGPGGTGKTRLAIEAAGELVGEFGAGVFWIRLAPVRDPELVVETIGQTLEARQELAKHVGDKEILLLLDNLEHVVDSAIDLAALLRACPNLSILVTSRELLRVEGEVVYEVPALAEAESTELFSARAGIEADDSVAELCSRLDNLPLAVELAAARVSVLSPSQILERISHRLDLFKAGRDVDPRQQTLRTTIAWSYDLLAEDGQQLFERMAVFRGGCTIEAAEEVVDANLDALQSLVDKSLIRHSDERFWMLETIREYGLELLDQSSEADAVHRRHADHYVALAELAYAERFERGLTWVRLLDEEQNNLRAALDHLQRRDQVQYLRLAGALGWYWFARSHFAEGTRRLEDALASTAEDGPLAARALTSLGLIDDDEADILSRHERAVELLTTAGDDTELAVARDALGWALYMCGEKSRASEVFEQNLELARSRGQEALVNRSIAGVCQLLVATGEFERAEPLALELHASTRDSEDVSIMCSADHYLSDCAIDRRDYALAEQHRVSALETVLTIGDVMQQTIEVLGLAFTAAGLGRDEDALRLEGAIDAKWKELGVSHAPPLSEAWRKRDLGAARTRLGDSRAQAAFDEGQAMTWDRAVELALGKDDSSA
jgi:predicted ATPase